VTERKAGIAADSIKIVGFEFTTGAPVNETRAE
jgi:hypothetical protein